MNDLVFIDKGELKTNSVVLAKLFERPHKHVMESIRSLESTGHLVNGSEFWLVKFTDLKGEKRPMFELTERGILIAMPFIGGKKSRDGQVVLVDAFLQMRDLLEDHHGQLQKELQDFELECRYSKERASLAGRTLRQRQNEITALTARKVELEAKFQHQLRLEN